MIYEMALTDPSGAVCIDVDPSSSDESRPGTAIIRLSSTGDGSRPSSLSPNLLATSKRVRGEALGILFGQPFVFKQPMALLLFLLSLGPGTSAELRDVALQDYDGDKRRYLACSVMRCAAVGLRRFSLCLFHRGDYHYTTDTALARDTADEFKDLFSPFIKAFSARHGTDALMEVVKFFDCGNQAHQGQVLGPVNNNQATTLDECRFVARQCTGDRVKSIVAEIEEIIADRLDRSWKI